STIVGVSTDATDLNPLLLNPQLQQFETEPTTKHGYSLTSDVLSSNSGVFRASGKNVHLKQGTELAFGIAPTATDSTATGNN
ncbi:MAG TPA: hypothetical protein VGM27_09800, partial [Acidobacteriaceae bacterium]